eukprot:scaffold873_cov252-Pinguiococcus_pyrenoidosus.AAC.21
MLRACLHAVSTRVRELGELAPDVHPHVAEITLKHAPLRPRAAGAGLVALHAAGASEGPARALALRLRLWLGGAGPLSLLCRRSLPLRAQMSQRKVDPGRQQASRSLRGLGGPPFPHRLEVRDVDMDTVWVALADPGVQADVEPAGRCKVGRFCHVEAMIEASMIRPGHGDDELSRALDHRVQLQSGLVPEDRRAKERRLVPQILLALVRLPREAAAGEALKATRIVPLERVPGLGRTRVDVVDAEEVRVLGVKGKERREHADVEHRRIDACDLPRKKAQDGGNVAQIPRQLERLVRVHGVKVLLAHVGEQRALHVRSIQRRFHGRSQTPPKQSLRLFQFLALRAILSTSLLASLTSASRGSQVALHGLLALFRQLSKALDGHGLLLHEHHVEAAAAARHALAHWMLHGELAPIEEVGLPLRRRNHFANAEVRRFSLHAGHKREEIPEFRGAGAEHWTAGLRHFRPLGLLWDSCSERFSRADLGGKLCGFGPKALLSLVRHERARLENMA